MAGKDPAFLFYTLEWLQITAKLYPAEKGIFMDLLCHQHRDGSITDEVERLARTVGLTVDQFQPIWSTVRLLFDQRDGNRLVNLWLEEKMANRSTGRSTNSHVRSILSRFGVLVRKAKASSPEIIEQIKKEFNIIDYQSFELDEAIERLTNWWTNRYNQLVRLGSPIDEPKKNLVIENENENKDRIEDDVGGVEGEEVGREEFSDWKPPEGPDWPAFPNTLQSGMYELFLAEFPAYPRQENIDLAACQRIGYEIGNLHGWPWESCHNGRMEAVLANWKEIVKYLKTNKWFRTKPLYFLAENFQALILAKNDPENGKQSTRTTDDSKFTATGSPAVQTVVGPGSRNF